MARRTRKMAKLHLPAVAENIEILSYRSGALVVADWVEGSSVKAVAESGQTLHTEAVANALAPLAGAMAAARPAAGRPLPARASARCRGRCTPGRPARRGYYPIEKYGVSESVYCLARSRR